MQPTMMKMDKGNLSEFMFFQYRIVGCRGVYEGVFSEDHDQTSRLGVLTLRFSVRPGGV